MSFANNGNFGTAFYRGKNLPSGSDDLYLGVGIFNDGTDPTHYVNVRLTDGVAFAGSGSSPVGVSGSVVTLSGSVAGILVGGQPASPLNPVPVTFPSVTHAAFGNVLTAQEELKVQLQFPYGIQGELVNSSGVLGGSVTTSLGRAVLQTGANPAGAASLESKSAIRYLAGQGVRVKMAGLFSVPQASSYQEVGVGDDLDGYFFGYSGSQFGINRRQNGTDNWVPQTAWNFDRMDGTGATGQVLSPQSGNIYSIDYQWLGFGAIRFFVEDANTGQFALVHMIRYPNANTVPSVLNPTLPLRMAARNWGSVVSVGPSFSSLGGYTQGSSPLFGIRRSANNDKSAQTETPIVSILNTGSFNGVRNRIRVRLDYGSFANLGKVGVEFRLVLNPSGSGFDYRPMSGGVSPVSFDYSGSLIAGGRELFVVQTPAGANEIVDFSPYEFRLDPNDQVVVTASGSALSETLVGLSWIEEI